MLTFSPEFFERETRDGFSISKTMKCAWAAQMEVLLQIDAICKENGITYFAFWGTLLGAVRHKGYIPWDDDIDIAMKREDYVRFGRIAKAKLPKEYCVLNIYTEEEYENTFTRVTNSRNIDVSKEHLEKYHGCPFIVGVDIFPLDYIPRNAEKAETQKVLLGMIAEMVPLAHYVEEHKNEDPEVIKDSMETIMEGAAALKSIMGITIDKKGNLENQLRRAYDRICSLYSKKDGNILTSFPEYIQGNGFLLKDEWFSLTELPFENIILPAPEKYDEILTALFGDYMTPARNTAGHDYPFYKEQLGMLHERNMWLDVEE